MKKLLILTVLLSTIYTLGAQDRKPVKENLVPYIYQKDSIEGYQVFIDANNELQFICIIDSINFFKDEMYNKLVTYFTPPFEDAKSEMTVKDRANGKISGNKYLKDYSTTTFEYLNANVKTKNFYTFSANMMYQVDIKDHKIRLKLSIQRFYVKVEQIPMSAVTLDYNKVLGRSAPLVLLPVIDTPKAEERFKNSLNDGTNKAELKAFDDLCKKNVGIIEEVYNLMFGIVKNKAVTNDW